VAEDGLNESDDSFSIISEALERTAFNTTSLWYVYQHDRTGEDAFDEPIAKVDKSRIE